ncbi:MAG TPA: hypothetical protein VKB51_08700 [bacterium]|nr:hypothetical protein [bacterium]
MTMSTRARWAKRIAVGAVLLLAGLALLGGCAAKGPLKEPPKVDEAALKREAEEQAKREAEEARLAEERRKAEEQRQKQELMQAFGPVGEPPPVPGQPATAPAAPTTAAAAVVPGAAAAPGAAPTEVPFDQAVPPLPPEPTVRVVVLSHDTPLQHGRQVALLIGEYDRERIEERLGMAVKILYVAESTQPLPRPSEIHYRKSYLRAAQSMAEAMSAQQWIGPMTTNELHQKGVDVIIHIGKGYR